MVYKPDFLTAGKMLIESISPLPAETVPLQQAVLRLLSADVFAAYNVPDFNRSAYDGYAFRSEDTASASSGETVLQITEEIRAGSVPGQTVRPGTAAKILTGAPIPPGADAVAMFEKTTFTEKEVRIPDRYSSGENVVLVGEDIKRGEKLLSTGCVLDGPALGVLASQRIEEISVYRIPVIGLISTGSELAEKYSVPEPGHIVNTNFFSLCGILCTMGCKVKDFGTVEDSTPEIRERITQAAAECDAVISTGGISAGDYDLTAAAMKEAGAVMLFKNVNMKPGMACACGLLSGKPVMALSGNPAACVTGFYALAAGGIRKLMGYAHPEPNFISMTLKTSYNKRSPVTRMLRGTADFSTGKVSFSFSPKQGNAALSSLAGCSAMAMIPAGSGPLPAGSIVRGMLI